MDGLQSFWKKGFKMGQGQSGDASEKIDSLKLQFVERNKHIIGEIENLKKDLNKEKSELTTFIELRTFCNSILLISSSLPSIVSI